MIRNLQLAIIAVFSVCNFHYSHADIPEGDRDSIITFRYDINGDITDGDKDLYFYDSLGNEIKSEYYEWDTDNEEWFLTGEDIYSYDENGHVDTNESYYWDEDEMDFIGDSKRINVIDSATGAALSTITYEWDIATASWVLDRKEESMIDTNGNTIERIQYNWDDGLGDWVESDKYERVYTPEGRQLGRTTYTWDGSAWEGNYYEMTFLDVNGFDSLYIDSTWNGTSWDPRSRENYTVDGSGNIIGRVEYDWNSGWEQQDSTARDYDIAGNEIFYEKYSWSGSSWEGSSKQDVTYNLLNEQTEVIRYIWNGSGWDLDKKTNTTFNGNGDQLQYRDSVWTGSNYIVGSTFWDFSYDGNGHLSEVIYHQPSAGKAPQDLYAYRKDEYSYDANGNCLGYQSYNRDTINDVWVENTEKEETIYDAQGDPTENTYEWNAGTSSWYLVRQRKSYYVNKQVVASINENVYNFISLYPNPTSEYLNVSLTSGKELKSIAIIDLSGQLKHTGSENRINVSNYSSGIYVIIIETGDKILRSKFVIQ